ncbi:hypothetical protein, partial [Actinomadura fibrosa]
AAPLWARAARLTGDARRRASLLLRALETALEVADHDQAARILDDIDARDLPAEDRVMLRWLQEITEGGWSGAARLGGHVAAAERLRQAGRDERALYVVHRVAVRAYYSAPGRDVRDAMVRLLDRLDLPPRTPRLVAALGLVAPVERSAEVVERLDGMLGDPGLTGMDLTELTAGAVAVGALGHAARLAADATAANRRQGNLVSLTWALAYQAWCAVQLGNPTLGRVAAAEAHELAVETRQLNYVYPNMLNHGHAEALRGDCGTARDMAERCERDLLSKGAHTMLALVQVVRGVAALAEGRYAEAHEKLDAIFQPSAPAYHPFVRFSVIAHLAEAGMHCGRRDRVAARVRELAPFDEAGAQPLLRVALRCARALAAPQERADGALRSVLDTDLTAWPFERARLQLTYGALLRRRRRP